MKRLLLLLLILLIPAASSQEIAGFVNDYAGVLSEADEANIETVLKEIYDSGAAQYAVVTITSLNGSDIESVSYNIAEGNLGDEEKNNGLLLLVAVEDRQFRFETGRGLEPILPDITTGIIGRRYIVPNFREGDYAGGVYEASIAVRDVLLNNTESDYPVEEESETSAAIGIVSAIIIIMVVFIVIAAISRSRTKGIRRDENDYFTAAYLLSEMFRRGRGGGGFSGGSSGGGFGGGSFGGGGSSGRW